MHKTMIIAKCTDDPDFSIGDAKKKLCCLNLFNSFTAYELSFHWSASIFHKVPEAILDLKFITFLKIKKGILKFKFNVKFCTDTLLIDFQEPF